MNVRKLSFVKTNFRARSVHFNAVFIAYCVLNVRCEGTERRGRGVGCVRFRAVLCGFCAVTTVAGGERHQSIAASIRRRHRSRGIALSTLEALSHRSRSDRG